MRYPVARESAHEGMKNQSPILVFDCGDGRTEVKGTTEVGLKGDAIGASHSFQKD